MYVFMAYTGKMPVYIKLIITTIIQGRKKAVLAG